jgi:hypothetical protein
MRVRQHDSFHACKMPGNTVRQRVPSTLAQGWVLVAATL